MSECVVRMEMPKRCYECDMADGITCMATGGVYGREVPKMTWIRRRPDWCPIVCQLPERHGRLIDWDALEKKGIKLARKVNEYRTEIGIPSDELFIVPADEYPVYMSQWLGKAISAEKQTNWIGEEMVEQQIDKDVSRFADGEWWKEMQE